MRTHIVGIKGAGVSALAKILQARGARVCGSDVPEEFLTDRELLREGIRIESFMPSHVLSDPLDRVIYSTAWKDSEEVRAARARGILLQSYPEALGALFAEYDQRIAVAGSHGKTTSSALLAHILKSAGQNITAVIGSTLLQYGTNAFAGAGSTMVIEADEYENKLAYYSPTALLITAVDYDHPDYFTTPDAYDAVFRFAAKKTVMHEGRIVACGDDDGVARVLAGIPFISYGVTSASDYAVRDIRVADGRMHYTLCKHGGAVGAYSLAMPGAHNVINACGVLALCDTLGLVALATGAELAETFQGVARRFEYKGMRGNMRLYDDFAHHPTEIVATLSAARTLFPTARIWCVFGAHTYTRTQALFDDFAKSFCAADMVFILDIYGSAREPQGTVHGADLAAAIQRKSGNAIYTGTHAATVREIADHIDEIDVLITMGAGDVYRVGDELLLNNSKIKDQK